MDDKETDSLDSEESVRALFESTLEVLRSARTAMIEALRTAPTQDKVPIEDLVKSQKLVVAALDAAVKTEQRLHDWTNAKDRNKGDGGLDLASARHDIGCRLDRLRACCRSE